jgi:hypothetical protein
MRSDGQNIFAWLVPALLVLVTCGSGQTPGATTGRGGAGADATGAAGAPGTAGAGGTVGVEMGFAGMTGSGGNAGSTVGAAGTTGTAGASDAGRLAGDGVPDGPPPDTASAGTELAPYDGGIVNVINAGNWNETTIHPFSKRRMLVRDRGGPRLALLDFGNPTPLVWRMVTGGQSIFAAGIQLIGNNQVLGGTSNGYQVFDFADGHVIKTVTGFPNTTSVYRVANGETMVAQGIPALPDPRITLSFLDKTDTVSHAITYRGFGYVRMARPTRNKTFLVPADTTLFEGDADGNILWSTTATQWFHIWEPLLMSDGNVLLATDLGASLDIVDRNTHMVTKRYGTQTMPMAATFRPYAFDEFQILPNGNFITSNTPKAGAVNPGIQVIEFNPAGDVVWFYKQDSTVFTGIEGVLVIDGMDPKDLHVQEISPDSTWQPVIPTPP